MSHEDNTRDGRDFESSRRKFPPFNSFYLFIFYLFLSTTITTRSDGQEKEQAGKFCVLILPEYCLINP
jgi:hypothetical protein